MTEEVDATHYLTYRVILPLMVCLGIVGNGLCIITLTRPALRAARVNGYFLTLAVSDLLVCVFHIPVITSITGCTFSSYTEAFYFTHFGWTLVGISQALGTYTIVWLSFDRFVAIWFYDLYPRIQQKPMMRSRLLVTALLCVLFHLVLITDGRVYCSVQDDALCTTGKWVSVTGYENHFNMAWHKVYLAVFGMFIRWIPCCLLLLFNLGLVIGVVRGRITFPGTQEFGKGGERTLIATTIAITATYILFTFPITVFIIGYNTHLEDRCSGGYAREILRAVGNVFQLLEHIVHILFFIGLYHGFRRELKILLFLEKRGEAQPGAAHKDRHINLSQYGGLEPPGPRTQSSVTPDRHSIRPTIVEVI